MLSEILPELQAGLENRPFEGSLKFDCGEAGVIVLADGTATDVDRDTDCTLTLSEENLVKLLTGKLNAMTAVMMGKIKISGNPAVAMRLADLLKA
ncbi:MAG: SCP2 sterol-binding domain-containing protein [Aestuariivita sp.]|uniref:SCP2 sterol-binding domain-containing protein n=1 Tax=Aestuariivita sp. TaxID=1872407 RepID=UPI003BAE5CDF